MEPYFSYPSITQVTQYDAGAGGGLIQTRNQTFAINAVDNFGNVLQATSDNGAREVTETDITYANNSDPTTWLVAEPTKVVETSSIHLPPPLQGKSKTRTTAFKYDAQGSVEWKVIEPGFDSNGQIISLPQPQPDGVKSRFIHYVRDASDGQIGLITQDNDFSASPKQRTEAIYRDGNDRVFPTRIANKLGHMVHVAIEPTLGTLAAVQDENGNYSRWKYDTFGRLKRSEPSGAEPVSTGYLGYANGASVDQGSRHWSCTSMVTGKTGSSRSWIS